MMFFRSRRKGKRPSQLDAVTFDAGKLKLLKGKKKQRIWRTEGGDLVVHSWQDEVPDIKADLDCIEDVRRFCSGLATSGGLGVIEIEMVEVSGCRAVQTIFRQRQDRGLGFVYLGAITLPFRDLSHVIRVECEERGMTGTREVLVEMIAMENGRVKTKELPEPDPTQPFQVYGPEHLEGWIQDPYDLGLEPGFARYLCEDEEFDAMLPDHPLSCVRRLLGQIQGSLCVSDELKARGPFEPYGNLEGIQQAAVRILEKEDVRHSQGEHEYRQVAASDFSHLDLGFYDNTQRLIEGHGFRFIADVEDATVTREGVVAPTFTRVMSGPNGEHCPCFYHTVQAGQPDETPRDGAVPFETKAITFGTRFSDGTLMETSNLLENKIECGVKGMERHVFTRSTPLAELMERHRRAVEARFESDPDLAPVPIHTYEDYVEAAHQSLRLCLAHRRSSDFSYADWCESIADNDNKRWGRLIGEEVDRLREERRSGKEGE